MQNQKQNGIKVDSLFHNNPVTIIRASRELVDGLLANNDGNRTISKARVESIASDILNGRWKFNGGTIVVDGDGRLIDGQHRLSAIRAAGYPAVKLILVRICANGGDADAVFRTIDSGKPRTMSDTFGIEGVKYSSRVAAICRIMCLIARGRAGFIPTKGEMSCVYDLMRESIDAVTSFGGTSCGVVTFQAASLAAFAVMAYLSGNVQCVLDFADKVRLGAGLAKDSPHYRLMCYLNSNRGKHVSTDMQIDTFCATIRALNKVLFSNGKAVTMSTVRGVNATTIANLYRMANGLNKPIFAALAA